MAPLEANASGRPCIAFGSGGALDTVRDGVTGVLFHQPTAQSLADAMLRGEQMEWDGAKLRQHAEKFDRTEFAKKLVKLIASVVAKRSAR